MILLYDSLDTDHDIAVQTSDAILLSVSHVDFFQNLLLFRWGSFKFFTSSPSLSPPFYPPPPGLPPCLCGWHTQAGDPSLWLCPARRGRAWVRCLHWGHNLNGRVYGRWSLSESQSSADDDVRSGKTSLSDSCCADFCLNLLLGESRSQSEDVDTISGRYSLTESCCADFRLDLIPVRVEPSLSCEDDGTRSGNCLLSELCWADVSASNAIVLTIAFFFLTE